MIERRISRRVVALATALSIGAAGIGGYDLLKPSGPSKRVISERVLSEKVDYTSGIDLVVSGSYGTDDHNQPFVSHYVVSCEEAPASVVHSESIIGDSYSLEAFNNDQAPDRGDLCVRHKATIKPGIETDTNAVLSEFDHHFKKAHPEIGDFDGAVTRIDFPHNLAGLFRRAVIRDANHGFGVIFFPEEKQNKYFQMLKKLAYRRVGNENVYINVRENS